MEEKKAFIEKIVREGNIVLMEVTSFSMYPHLSPGDLILVGRGKLKIGDLVVFRKSNTFIVHRMIFKLLGLYIFKGDSVKSLDIVIGKEKIIGKAFVVKKNF